MNTIFELQAKTDHRGRLYPFNLNKDWNFIPKRLFFIRDVPAGTVRGNHAHYNATQILICVKGNIDISMSNGQEEYCHSLTVGGYVIELPLTWTSMKFLTEDSILLVLSSNDHSEEDYIKDFQTFLAAIKKEVK